MGDGRGGLMIKAHRDTVPESPTVQTQYTCGTEASGLQLFNAQYLYGTPNSGLQLFRLSTCMIHRLRVSSCPSSIPYLYRTQGSVLQLCSFETEPRASVPYAKSLEHGGVIWFRLAGFLALKLKKYLNITIF